ncbi:MAG: efflux RND transporter permease subunit [Oceanococcus sp.]
MNLTRTSLGNPAAAVVVALLLCLLGAASLYKLPIQLLPSIDNPEITIWTNWRGAAPSDMESVIVEQQERVLQAIPGLDRIESNINQGNGNLNLRFKLGTDMQRAYLDVINRLQQTPNLPDDAEGPWVNLGGGDFTGGNAASLLVRSINTEDSRDPAEFHDVIKLTVEPRMARISGVGRVDLQSQRPEELHIVLDVARAAAMNIQLSDLIAVVSAADDISGGFADVGRRQYTVRFMGKAAIDDIENLIVAYREFKPVYLGDIAQVRVQRRESQGFTLRNGYPAYYLTLGREPGSNTVAILDEVNIAIAELNAGALADAGLAIELSYDASIHIRRAISLVQGNLILGGVLATLVLFFFLRNWRSTLLVGLAIPICLLTAFATLQAFGRSLNVISLAGLAFAVGLVLDAAIIVMENIVRLRQNGEPLSLAVLQGAQGVATALLASTATSVAIFLPILFMGGPEGQLFSDLALTLSIAVIVSLLVALSLLPVAYQWALRGKTDEQDRMAGLWDRITVLVMRYTEKPTQRWSIVLLTVGGMSALAWSLMPSADYLPQARSDNVWGNFSLPPGVSKQALERDLANIVVQRMQPYMSGEKQPKVAYYNLSSWNRAWTGMAVYAQDPKESDALMDAMRNDILKDLPDTRSFVVPGSLLNFSGGGNRQIDVDIHGADLDRLLLAARTGMAKLQEALPGIPVRPQPDLELAEPELLLHPDPIKTAQAGLRRSEVGRTVRAYTDGLYVGEYFDGNERMNVLIKTPDWHSPEQLADMPLATPLGGLQRLGELTHIERAVGPSTLRRIDGQRTVSLRVFPPENMTLEDAINTIRQRVEPAINAVLAGDGGVSYRGSADGLEQALQAMGLNMLYALAILLMILVAMFRSVGDALCVLSVMPLAFAGGVLSLWAMNLFSYQSMDLLTMSGFVILLGLVVNNAILLVDRTRSAEAEGLSRDEAVRSAIRERARPIYMSTLTSIFGMLPLMLVPGTGAEIYRGLASIIVGGMTISAIFTLLLLPSLLRMGRIKEQSSDRIAGGVETGETA